MDGLDPDDTEATTRPLSPPRRFQAQIGRCEIVSFRTSQMLRSLALIATLALAGALPHSMRRHKTLDRLSDEL